MTLRVEHEGAPDAARASAVAATLRDVAKVRGEVEFVPPGSLPGDGKLIEDARRYS